MKVKNVNPLDTFSIRRSVNIPVLVDGVSILSLIEIGGKVWNKDIIYQKFFEYGKDGVINELKNEIKKRGGDDKAFDTIMEIEGKKLGV